MNRPTPAVFDAPRKLSELPMGPAVKSGQLYDISAGMRTFRPVIDQEACVKCLQCFLVCPDGAVDKSGETLEIDYNYCKGCGVCASECRPGAIHMVKEAEV